jgi:hypothetical protein
MLLMTVQTRIVYFSSFNTYHERNAIMKPNHEKKNTLPYMLIGLKAGIDLAFLDTGLTSGALKRIKGSKPIFAICLM